MDGILTRENGVWGVKWYDLHSFGEGYHWCFTKLSNDSNFISYIKDGIVMYNVLQEGVEVEFEFQSEYIDSKYIPFGRAKLIFPEVAEFAKQKRINEYVKNGGEPWSIYQIDRIRDGGTLVILRPPQSKLTPIYIHKDYWTVHYTYPPTDNNIITDDIEKTYILDRLEQYKNDCQFELDRMNDIIKKVKL